MVNWLRSRGEHGQSLVEIAISFPIILLLMSGLFDLGRVYFTWVALEDAAAEGALYLALHPNWPTATECGDPRNAVYRVENASQGSLSGAFEVDWTRPGTNITYQTPASPVVGETVWIEIEYPFQLITPVISQLTGGNLTLRVRASQIIISTESVVNTCP